ncbi:dnaJ/Hsp40 cysteine-rich domain superfamily protein [Carex rostrata]
MEVSIGSPPISHRNLPFCRILTKGVQSTTNYGVLRPTQSPIRSNSFQVRASLINGIQRSKSSLESLFCYDKPVPEEKIEKPVGTSLSKKEIGNKPPCTNCHVKGAVLCTTCNGSGLYVDSILESQGIIVKVRCLGCGGTGNIMCSKCGGRGHMGSD